MKLLYIFEHYASSDITHTAYLCEGNANINCSPSRSPTSLQYHPQQNIFSNHSSKKIVWLQARCIISTPCIKLLQGRKTHLMNSSRNSVNTGKYVWIMYQLLTNLWNQCSIPLSNTESNWPSLKAFISCTSILWSVCPEKRTKNYLGSLMPRSNSTSLYQKQLPMTVNSTDSRTWIRASIWSL